MGGAKAKVVNSGEYKFQVVDQDYADYKQDPTSLRLAYHLAVSLFHLRDWTFAEHSGAANWPYATTIGNYQRDLENLCGDFGYMRDLANAVKHKELDASKKPQHVKWWGWQIPKFQWRLSNPAPFKAMHFRHELVLFLRQRPPNTSILKKRPMQSCACGTNSLPPTAGCKRAASELAGCALNCFPKTRRGKSRRISPSCRSCSRANRKGRLVAAPLFVAFVLFRLLFAPFASCASRADLAHRGRWRRVGASRAMAKHR